MPPNRNSNYRRFTPYSGINRRGSNSQTTAQPISGGPNSSVTAVSSNGIIPDNLYEDLVNAVEWSVETSIEWDLASDYWHQLEGLYGCRREHRREVSAAEDETGARAREHFDAMRKLSEIVNEIRRIAGAVGVQLIRRVRAEHTRIVWARPKYAGYVPGTL
ncbi:hypothetical protein VKT23_006613 [Stygiomarasmius scandens]|uniref:Uncharacterized protein n=1 Tax=Marasmiellus scandens TaxID=2682957 RepID=A0ABR1JU04_9AGAR